MTTNSVTTAPTRRPANLWRKIIIVSLAIPVVLAGLVFAGLNYMFFAGRVSSWDSTPKVVDGITVFSPYYERKPSANYTFAEHWDTFRKIDWTVIVKRRLGMAVGPPGQRPIGIEKLAPVGNMAPDFELTRTDGTRMRLSDSRGKLTAFMFVAMTCGQARLQVNKWTERLSRKYDRDDVEIFLVYSRERHAGERGYREFQFTRTTEEKFTYARMMSQLTDLPIAVDPIEEEVLGLYGEDSNPAFVVDRDGRLIYEAKWADVSKVEQVIDQMLSSVPARSREDSRPTGQETGSATGL